MNWLTNFVLPKIRGFVIKKAVPDNLWAKCPGCDQMLFLSGWSRGGSSNPKIAESGLSTPR
jgi:hypothetical protein